MLRGVGWGEADGGGIVEMSEKFNRQKHIRFEAQASDDSLQETILAGNCDFVVMNLASDNRRRHSARSVRLARRLIEDMRGVPVYVLTNRHDTLSELGAAGRSDVTVLWNADSQSIAVHDICTDLRRRRLYLEFDQVFLITSEAQSTSGYARQLEYFLEIRGVTPKRISPIDAKSERIQENVRRMDLCSAIVSLCTPENGRLPNNDIVFQLGLAIGLTRGLERLVVLSKSGPDHSEQTMLPSALNGVLPLEFEGELREPNGVFAKLERRLEELRVALKKPDGSKGT